MHKAEDINELLEVLQENNINAWMKPSNRLGSTVCVLFEYPLNQVGDLKGLALRLKNFNDLGTEGLG